jgi:hypothetical protein
MGCLAAALPDGNHRKAPAIERRSRCVDARAANALERALSPQFDATGASVAALLASCPDAASEQREGRPLWRAGDLIILSVQPAAKSVRADAEDDEGRNLQCMMRGMKGMLPGIR